MARVPREKILPAQLERRVYERLRDEIVSAVLQPGEQLVEARIASELGVSKTPVREALIRLQRDGLVAIEPYRGARVLEPSRSDIHEVLELRRLLECHIARDLAVRRPPEVIEALQASIRTSRAAHDAGNMARLLDSLTDFSDILAEACGNSRMTKLLSDLRSVVLLIGNTSRRVAGREERSISEHEAILEAILRSDPEAAARATEAHISSIEHDSLERDIGSEPALTPSSDGRVSARSRRSPRTATGRAPGSRAAHG
jgi:DNA-binding GntR family transcriptional regulator